MGEVSIDFETRSELDLTKCGAYVYAEHGSTTVLCLSYSINNGEIKTWFPYASDPSNWPTDLLNCVTDNYFIHAFNAEFERCMWRKCERLFGWPYIHPNQWRCSAACARALSLPRALGKCSEALGLPVEKDQAGRRLMLKMTKTAYAPKQTDEDLKRLGAYCAQDVKTEQAVKRAIPSLSSHEFKVWQLDQQINERGFLIDQRTVTSAIHIITKLEQEASKELPRITDGKVERVGELEKIKQFCREKDTHLLDLQKETVVAQLNRRDLDPTVRRVLELRQQFGRSAVKKYLPFTVRTNKDGRARGAFMYSGAVRTRRWSGQGIQPQNMKRGYSDPRIIDGAVELVRRQDIDTIKMLLGDPMEVISGLTRSMIIPAPNHRFIVADFSGIEARVLSVLASDHKALDDFKNKRDPYKTMAAAIFKVPHEEVTKDQRALGKVAILALGYGMGYRKFVEACKNYGIEISESFAKNVVRLYRDIEHQAVSILWRLIEDNAKLCIKTRKPVKRGKFYHFEMKGDTLIMVLPSGRKRHYHEAKIKAGFGNQDLTYWGVGLLGKWECQKTYGGKLVENLVQSTARDLFAEAMLALDDAGYRIVIHMHDEVVLEMPEGKGSLEEVIQIMCSASDWAKDWPIEAEGWEGKRYRK